MVRQHAPATLRNREPIAAVLARELPASGTVLEVASGTGEHAVFFAARFPALRWQPSDVCPEALASIAAYLADYTGENLAPPLLLDAAAPASWPVDAVDAVLCINMVHISPWEATIGLFKGCAQVLTNEAPIILYGPYLEGEVETAASNLEFDQSLKVRNPPWGLRHLDDVDRVASEHGFERTSRFEMPANNLTLVYKRRLA
jgi:hypothetical protein